MILRRRTTRVATVLATGAVVVLLAAACAPTAGPGLGTATAPAPGASAPAASAPPTIDAADVTCENMLSPETVDSFTATGWTVREDPFVILDLELPEGTACTWGDFSSPTNDDLVLFGWSPISTADADATEAALEAEGWLREEDSRGVLITEDPDLALRVDDDGYGVTYLFGDGWVKVSDTRQGLDLIELG
ncbi:hypothetical protein [Microbacterium oleivorans]|uniref:hypothetical protein n=1 Tax=Microbacterium oleivorans TaxID=273677 RepID=UPI00203E46F6|nr:hypothetical protein [Microbacterium oleivorans]MCM3696322.1 hypothetical protein [Microbacterium oleivorans]